MKILLISDVETREYYESYVQNIFKGYDLIISCGDLNKHYLEFIATMAPCPVLYVRGNHDDLLNDDPPGGCICIEEKVYEYKGIRFLGLGGSIKYDEKAKNQYTEKEMKGRINRLKFWWKLRKGFDVLVTHSPMRGCGDMDTRAHKGFECLVDLVDKYNPKYMFYGHVHMNYGRIERVRKYKDTEVVNAFKSFSIDINEIK